MTSLALVWHHPFSSCVSLPLLFLFLSFILSFFSFVLFFCLLYGISSLLFLSFIHSFFLSFHTSLSPCQHVGPGCLLCVAAVPLSAPEQRQTALVAPPAGPLRRVAPAASWRSTSGTNYASYVPFVPVVCVCVCVCVCECLCECHHHLYRPNWSLLRSAQ